MPKGHDRAQRSFGRTIVIGIGVALVVEAGSSLAVGAVLGGLFAALRLWTKQRH